MDPILEIQKLTNSLKEVRENPSNSEDKLDTIISGLDVLAEELAGSLKASEDVTAELEKHQVALDKSQERWQLALEGAGDGLWDWDMVSGHVYYSPRWEEMFGYELGEFPQTLDAFSERVFPEDLDKMFAEVNRYLSREIPAYAFEFRMVRQDGSIMWTLHRAAAIFNEDGQAVRMIGTTADITNRKRAEDELNRSNTFLLQTNSVARIGGWELDLVKGILFWTDMTKEIHGVPLDYEPQLETGINFYKEGESRDTISRVVNEAIQDGTAYDVELEIITTTGRELWVRAKGEVEFEDGKCIRLYGTFQDIDEKKKVEGDLVLTRKNAVVANNAKTEFLAQMSHELRTPLNVILGYTQIMVSSETSGQNKESLNTIRNSGEHLLSLIDDMLNMSAIELGKLELESQVFSLKTALQNVRAMMDLRAQEKGLTFIYEPNANIPDMVFGDVLKLRQVLLNLLSNSIKFTDEGQVEFKVNFNDDKLYVVISDTGAGIAPEYLKKLFEPFQRAGSEKTNIQGTGLGLAISRKMVQLMGGEIKVESSPGIGSTFSFEIILNHVSFKKSIEALDVSKPIGYSGERKKILIVDDDPENRRLLNVYLRPMGFELLDAVNGKDAFQKTITFWPHLILLDLMMPEMDGFETCLRLRKTPQGTQAKIVVLSADAYPETQQRILNAGSDKFLSKPVRFGELLGTLGDSLKLDWVF